MDLGLLIFIIFVLVKVFGKVADIKDKLPKDWESKIPRDWQENWPPVPKGFPFPWEEESEEETTLRGGPDNEGRRKTLMEEKARLKPRRNLIANAEQDEGTDIYAQGAANSQVSSQTTARAGTTVRSGTSAVEADQGHPLLSYDSVLNGIIMSELLQPPKSRRRR